MTPPLQQLPEARRNVARLMRALIDAQRSPTGRRITPSEGRDYAGALLTIDAQAARALGIETEGTR